MMEYIAGSTLEQIMMAKEDEFNVYADPIFQAAIVLSDTKAVLPRQPGPTGGGEP